MSNFVQLTTSKYGSDGRETPIYVNLDNVKTVATVRRGNFVELRFIDGEILRVIDSPAIAAGEEKETPVV